MDEQLEEFDELEYAKLSVLVHSGEASEEECRRFQDISDSVFGTEEADEMSEEDADYLAHYGTPRHSGRYPWGSGDDPYQHEAWYKGRERLRAQGLTETEIAKLMNLPRPVYSARVSIAKNEMRQKQYARPQNFMRNWGRSGRRSAEEWAVFPNPPCGAF